MALVGVDRQIVGLELKHVNRREHWEVTSWE
jgi:hypothetical protein